MFTHTGRVYQILQSAEAEGGTTIVVVDLVGVTVEKTVRVTVGVGVVMIVTVVTGTLVGCSADVGLSVEGPGWSVATVADVESSPSSSPGASFGWSMMLSGPGASSWSGLESSSDSLDVTGRLIVRPQEVEVVKTLICSSSSFSGSGSSPWSSTSIGVLLAWYSDPDAFELALWHVDRRVVSIDGGTVATGR